MLINKYHTDDLDIIIEPGDNAVFTHFGDDGYNDVVYDTGNDVTSEERQEHIQENRVTDADFPDGTITVSRPDHGPDDIHVTNKQDGRRQSHHVFRIIDESTREVRYHDDVTQLPIWASWALLDNDWYCVNWQRSNIPNACGYIKTLAVAVSILASTDNGLLAASLHPLDTSQTLFTEGTGLGIYNLSTAVDDSPIAEVFETGNDELVDEDTIAADLGLEEDEAVNTGFLCPQFFREFTLAVDDPPFTIPTFHPEDILAGEVPTQWVSMMDRYNVNTYTFNRVGQKTTHVAVLTAGGVHFDTFQHTSDDTVVAENATNRLPSIATTAVIRELGFSIGNVRTPRDSSIEEFLKTTVELLDSIRDTHADYCELPSSMLEASQAAFVMSLVPAIAKQRMPETEYADMLERVLRDSGYDSVGEYYDTGSPYTDDVNTMITRQIMKHMSPEQFGDLEDYITEYTPGDDSLLV